MLIHRVGCAGLLAGLALLGFLAFELFTGPRPEVRYLAPEASPYRLPWPAGVRRFCVQGNRGVVSHYEGQGEFSWDFAMPVGSPVCAARAGVVELVVEHHTARGSDQPNNRVVVVHEDGTRAHYLHLRQGGALVEVGQRVAQGEQIAESGNVGRSLLPHLHFHVIQPGGAFQPVSFREVPGDGVPRMFHTYRSQNPAPGERRD
ncbi:MAG: M23 family metallopeptidase [Planctomycetota bacterium]